MFMQVLLESYILLILSSECTGALSDLESLGLLLVNSCVREKKQKRLDKWHKWQFLLPVPVTYLLLCTYVKSLAPNTSSLPLCSDILGHLATVILLLLLILDSHVNIFMTLSSLLIVENGQSNVEDKTKLMHDSNGRYIKR